MRRTKVRSVSEADWLSWVSDWQLWTRKLCWDVGTPGYKMTQGGP